MSVSVGICSTAHPHAGAYASILQAMDGAALVGVADGDERRGSAFAEDHGVDLAPAADLLSRVDAVIVCSANADHAEWVERAARAGVDVLSEKPLATSREAALDVARTAEEAGVRLGVAMPLRFSEPVRRAREQYEAGEIGDLRAVSGTNRGQLPDPAWFVDPDAAGGGAAMDHTVHVVDLVHWLTGERVVEVYAELGRQRDLAVEDANVLSMELSGGARFLLDGSWSRPDEYHTWGDATVELTGTDGVLAVDCFDQSFRLTRDSGAETAAQSVFWGDDPNEGLLADFVEAVREDRPPEIPAMDGVEAVAVVDAVYESDRSGEPVTVEY